MSLLVAKELHKTYSSGAKPLEVLKGVSLELELGESMAILGASGAGKSTLLHILGALDPPDEGKVFFADQDIYRYSEKKLSRFRNRSVGFVFQFHHLLPMLTALENVMLPRMIAGDSQKKASECAIETLKQVGLGERLEHRPAELSGGEQQRVAIARALVMKPELLLADEPTGNLDSQTGEEVISLLLGLRQKHPMATVIVTHNEGLAKKLDRQMYLRDGKICN